MLNNRRRRLLSAMLDGYGSRVQKSIFEVVLDRKLFDKMVSEIHTHISSEQDRVLIYPLCANCAEKVHRLGCSDPAPGEETVFVV
ncbi:MAG: CRISPR-associated endonuclease Cas2 [Magnetococcales bacterium]|nr:CRISPR-associated endonuclease Cas2 [Magnetococcales bacterium]